MSQLISASSPAVAARQNKHKKTAIADERSPAMRGSFRCIIDGVLALFNAIINLRTLGALVDIEANVVTLMHLNAVPIVVA